MLVISNILSNEILSSSNEVIKVILSLLFLAGILPQKTFLTTSSDMGNY